MKANLKFIIKAKRFDIKKQIYGIPSYLHCDNIRGSYQISANWEEVVILELYDKSNQFHHRFNIGNIFQALNRNAPYTNQIAGYGIDYLIVIGKSIILTFDL